MTKKVTSIRIDNEIAEELRKRGHNISQLVRTFLKERLDQQIAIEKAGLISFNEQNNEGNNND